MRRRLSALLRNFAVFMAVVICLEFTMFAEPYTNVSIGVSASSAILIEADSGRVVFEKNADARRSMASTTKIMTALVAIENALPDMKVKIPKAAVGIEGSSIYLIENEILTLRELLYALMLQSANDAATAIAIAVGGSVSGFADMMNEKAAELGLTDTSFDNPHGLDSEDHYTTARELAVITAAALENELFRELVSTKKHAIPLNNEPDRRLLINHNRLLRTYDGCIGVKTGFTKKSGRCLVSAAERDGVTLIAVTLNASDDWNDHARMLDLGFSLYERITLKADNVRGYMPVVGGKEQTVLYSSSGEASISLPKDRSDIKRVVEMPRFFFAPMKAGDKLGRVVYYLDGQELASFDIVAEQGVNARKKQNRFLLWLKSLFDWI